MQIQMNIRTGKEKERLYDYVAYAAEYNILDACTLLPA